jgi:hypothetical protein
MRTVSRQIVSAADGSPQRLVRALGDIATGILKTVIVEGGGNTPVEIAYYADDPAVNTTAPLVAGVVVVPEDYIGSLVGRAAVVEVSQAVCGYVGAETATRSRGDLWAVVTGASGPTNLTTGILLDA